MCEKCLGMYVRLHPSPADYSVRTSYYARMARLAPSFLVPAGITDGLWEMNLGYARWTVYGGPGDDFVRIADHVENEETGTPIVVRQVFAPHPIERLVIPLWLGDTEHVITRARP